MSKLLSIDQRFLKYCRIVLLSHTQTVILIVASQADDAPMEQNACLPPAR